MIPILYDSSETTFTSNGLGRLAECSSCRVTEIRNGEYECEFTYPTTGRLYDQIVEGMIIACTHDDQGDRQPFVIYRRSAPINGVVTFNAHHYTYLLNNIIMEPYTAQSAGAAFILFKNNTINANPFTFWTDNTTEGTAKSEIPISVRAALGGTEGSVLDAFHGEYEWDVKTVKLHAQRGTDSGITIRYGKNLTDITQTKDELGTYNSAVGYWLGDDANGQQTLVHTGVISSQGVTSFVPVVLDLSAEFETPPSVLQLNAKTRSVLADTKPWEPNENIKIKFAQLWQTEEYKDVAALQRLSLCDRVSVYYPQLGVEVNNVEIIKVVYNVLLDRYDEMELGQPTSTLAQTLLKPYEEGIKNALKNTVTRSMMQAAIEHATQLITGGYGGTFKWKYNADGEPIELLILEYGDETIVPQHVWRWNAAGLGHSSNGYAGPYDAVAITMDGQINANAITVGKLSASMIEGGTLKVGGSGNGNGTILIYDAHNNLIGTLDNTGADLTGDIKMSKDGVTTKIGTIFGYDISPAVGQVIQAAYKGLQTTSTAQTFGKTSPSFSIRPQETQYSKRITVPSGAFSGFTGYNDALNYPDHENVTFVDRTFTVFAECNTGAGHFWHLNSVQLDDDFDPDDESTQRIHFSGVYYNRHMYFGKTCFSIGTPTTSGNADYPLGEVGGGTYYCNINNAERSLYLGNSRFAVAVAVGKIMEFTASGLSVLGNMVAYQSSSSRRYKHDIKAIEDKKLDPHRLYDLPVRQFEYNDDATLQYADMEGQTLPGFIAEEVAAVYPSAVIRGKDGKIESWDERRILPGMLALVQEQKKKIDSLEARIEKLESLVNSMIGD